jgi:hypothetical protein
MNICDGNEKGKACFMTFVTGYIVKSFKQLDDTSITLMALSSLRACCPYTTLFITVRIMHLEQIADVCVVA